MRRAALVPATILLALAAASARADEPVTGTWRGRPVTLRATGADGSAFCGAAGGERLTLRPVDGSRWTLTVERRVEAPAPVGLAGALEGRAGGTATTWGDARDVALRRSSGRLRGPEADLSAPDAAPSPTDTGWFEDADELEPLPGVRRHLDRALATGDHDAVRALGPLDTNLATAEEKARLVDHLLAGDTTDADRAWIRALLRGLREPDGPLPIRRAPPGEGPRVLEALRRRGALERLGDDGDLALFRALPVHVRSPDLAADLVVALAADADGDEERLLGAHGVLDRARAEGALDRVVALARERGGDRPGVRRVLAAASPTRRPVVFAHRGDPVHAPENTVAALEAAAERGATGVEIDLCFTRDGHVVLWHDADPDGAIALVRQLGLESSGAWRPTVPDVGRSARAPVHALTLAELRATHGYVERSGSGRAGVDTLEESAPALAAFERVILDVKLPGDRPDLFAPFARAVRRTLEAHGLTSRAIVMSPDARVVRGLKPHLPGCAFTHDVEITRVLAGGDHSAVAAARALGNGVASVGRPVVPKLDGPYDYYLQVLRRDRARIDDAGLDLELIAWTIDDELELREIIAVGVDGVLTNQVDRAAGLVRRLFPDQNR